MMKQLSGISMGLWAICAAGLLAAAALTQAQDAPGLACPSSPMETFAATLDGQPIDLHPFNEGSFGIFAVSKPGVIEIHAGFDVRWVDVRPLSAHVKPEIAPNHRDVRIAVSNTTPLTIEFNDDLGHVLHLFPYLPSSSAPREGQPHVRYFGPGLTNAGIIELASGDTVYLAPGAWVKGVIHAHDVKDIAILGPGVLDASEMTRDNAPYGGATPIYLEKTENARIEGVTIFNSHAWTVHLRQANHTRIDGIRVLNPGAWNGDDGIDVNSSSHVSIENVFIRTNDDCVVVKNQADVDTSDIHVQHSVLWNMPNGGNGVEIGFEMRSHTVRDVHFADLDMIHVQRGAAISIHNGDSDTVEDVSYDNIRVEDVRRKLIDFSVVYAPYGPDRPTTEKETRARMDQGGTWDAILCYLPAQKAELASHRGHIRNVTVRNLEVVDGALPYSIMAGYDAAHAVEGVTIQGLSYLGRPLTDAQAARLVTDYATNVEFR